MDIAITRLLTAQLTSLQSIISSGLLSLGQSATFLPHFHYHTSTPLEIPPSMQTRLWPLLAEGSLLRPSIPYLICLPPLYTFTEHHSMQTQRPLYRMQLEYRHLPVRAL
jgi:hypothetical protein